MARDSFVFPIPGIVLIVGREDEFPPPVEDIKLVVFNKIRGGEDGFKVIVNAIIPCGERVGHIESHDFALQVLLNGGIDAPVGVYSDEHNVVISDGLRGVGVCRINLRGLRSIPKLPEVLIASTIGVVDELDLSGEEVDLFGCGIEGSNGTSNNTDGAIGSVRSYTSVGRSKGKGDIKTSELIEVYVGGIQREGHITISECPKDVGVLPDGLIDELCLEGCTSEVVRD